VCVWFHQAAKFQQQGTRLRKKMWWDNVKVKILIVSGILLLGLIIFLVACFAGGRSCVGGNKGGGSNTAAPAPAENTLIPGSSGGTLGAPSSSVSGSPADSSVLVPGNAQTLG
jgi:hypothetical protein